KLDFLCHVDAIPPLAQVARGHSQAGPLLDRDLRIQAIDALGRIPDRQVVPILIDLLEDKEPQVAYEAWRVLDAITGRTMGDDMIWNFDPFIPSPALPGLIARWRRFWKENGDVFRPRRRAAY